MNADISVAIIAATAALAGVSLSTFSQNFTLKKQLEYEARREKEKKNQERILVYSEVLKMDGESRVETDAGDFSKFNLEEYRTKIRPVLYSDFHLLDQDISIFVLGIDGLIKACDFFEEIPRNNNDKLIEIYNKLLVGIELHIQIYRNHQRI